MLHGDRGSERRARLVGEHIQSVGGVFAPEALAASPISLLICVVAISACPFHGLRSAAPPSAPPGSDPGLREASNEYCYISSNGVAEKSTRGYRQYVVTFCFTTLYIALVLVYNYSRVN